MQARSARPFDDTVPDELANDPQSILDHAFVMSVNCGNREVAETLLGRGAEVNATPPGYHWRGTALHAACWRGDAGRPGKPARARPHCPS